MLWSVHFLHRAFIQKGWKVKRLLGLVSTRDSSASLVMPGVEQKLRFEVKLVGSCL